MHTRTHTHTHTHTIAGGPLSISNDVAQAFSLMGVREVKVRRVEREEVGLDLLEIKFKVGK